MVTAHLSTSKEQMRNVRDMLAAERSSKEKLSVRLTAQLDAANKRIGEY